MAFQACLPPLLFLSTTLLLSGQALAITASSGFCSRALNSQSCPNPPTFDSIDVGAYLGKWYEIGSTASFKLLTEAGLVCDQANYSLSAAGNVALVNSGLRAIGNLALAEVAAISLSTRGICSPARAICLNLAENGKVSEAIQQILEVKKEADPQPAAVLGKILADIASFLENVQLGIEAIANEVRYIQYLNGQISQGNATSVAQAVDVLEFSLQKALQQQESVEALVKQINTMSAQIQEASIAVTDSGKKQLDLAMDALEEVREKLTRYLFAMKVALQAIKPSASTLRLDGKPIDNGKISSVKGEAVQNKSSAGKLEVKINGVKAPYWILSVEGEASEGYKAALVFSCTENKIFGVTKSLFILSRTPQLSAEVVSRFLSLAESYGIFTDCDDPFIFTLQRGGNCGVTPLSSSNSFTANLKLML